MSFSGVRLPTGAAWRTRICSVYLRRATIL